VTDSDIDKKLVGALEPAQISIAAPGAGGEATYGQLFETTKAAAIKLIAGGMDIDEAAEQAAAMTFGKKYATAGALRFPRSFDPSEIELGAEQRLAEIGKLRLDLPMNLSGLTEDEARNAFAEDLIDGGRWITAQDESGAQLLDPLGDPVTIGGAPVIVTWPQLVKSAPARPDLSAIGVP